MNTINFKAKYIKDTQIKKLESGSYKPYNAHLIELEKSDFQVLNNLSNDWNTNLLDRIIDGATYELGRPTYHVYAMTTQKEDYKNLKKENIIGVLEFENLQKYNRLNYLQVLPDAISNNYGTYFDAFMNRIFILFGILKKRPYKDIGRAMVNYLKETYTQKDIALNALKEAKRFYKKLGFTFIKQNTISSPNMIFKHKI